MSDILDEILNDQNDEKKIKFIKKLLPSAIIITIIVAIMLATYNFYLNKKIDHRREMGDVLLKTLINDNLDYDLSLKSFDGIAAIAGNRAKELALLKEAGLLIEKNNLTEAKKHLEQIIADTKFHELTAAYARLRWLCLIIEDTKLSDEDKHKANEYFSYFSDENRPFYGMANIIKSIWYIRYNQEELALQILSKMVISVNISEIVKEQAKALILNIENNKGL